VPLPDFAAIDAAVGDARVIGLAEFAHQQPECLAFRNRLFQHLVESKGVSAIAAETSYIKSTAVDDYVTGRTHSPVVDAELLHGMFAWSPRISDENRALLEWMRAYNTMHPDKRPLRFYGVDLTGSRPGDDVFAHARETVDAALAYASRREPDTALAMRRRLQPGLEHFTRAKYGRQSSGEADAFTAALTDLIALFEERRPRWIQTSSALEFNRAVQNLQVARQHDLDFRTELAGRHPDTMREAALADNVGWVLEQEGEGARILVFASFDHLTRGPNAQFNNEQLGAHLATRMRRQYAAITTYWAMESAELPPSDDAQTRADVFLRPIAARLVQPVAFLDFRSHPRFSELISPDAVPPGFFDGVVFMRVTSKPPKW